MTIRVHILWLTKLPSAVRDGCCAPTKSNTYFLGKIAQLQPWSWQFLPDWNFGLYLPEKGPELFPPGWLLVDDASSVFLARFLMLKLVLSVSRWVKNHNFGWAITALTTVFAGSIDRYMSANHSTARQYWRALIGRMEISCLLCKQKQIQPYETKKSCNDIWFDKY